MKALKSIESFDAGGLLQPITLTSMPYQTSTRTRILKPDFAKKSWQVVAPYAVPQSLAR
jgi:hypothetical protein